MTFIQNHDQVANSARGLRCHLLTSPGRYRAMTALLLLAPGTPMLFQGQEFAASSPFLFFADHKPELAQLVAQGPRRVPGAVPQPGHCRRCRHALPDPGDPATFERCKLDFAERAAPRRGLRAAPRPAAAAPRGPGLPRASGRGGVDGAVLGPEAFVLRFFGDDGDDRLLLVNLGRDLHLDPAPEPLLAPPEGRRWDVLWSSEDPRYGGGGTPPLDTEDNWRIPGEAAVVLAARPAGRKRDRCSRRTRG